MASQHVSLPTSTRLGSKLQQMVDSMQSAYNQAFDLNAVIGTYDGDDVRLAVDIGLTGTSPEVIAAAIRVALSSAVANGFNQTDFVALMTKLG